MGREGLMDIRECLGSADMEVLDKENGYRGICRV
jgi:hypothetical protein